MTPPSGRSRPPRPKPPRFPPAPASRSGSTRGARPRPSRRPHAPTTLGAAMPDAAAAEAALAQAQAARARGRGASATGSRPATPNSACPDRHAGRRRRRGTARRDRRPPRGGRGPRRRLRRRGARPRPAARRPRHRPHRRARALPRPGRRRARAASRPSSSTAPSSGSHPTRLLPETLARDGVEEDLARLSGGTREQIAILTRLAFARLLARTGRATPVILDDAAGLRRRRPLRPLLAAIAAVAADVQVILLTCRERAFTDLPATRPILSLADTAAAAAV